jgi:hypothetical protein
MCYEPDSRHANIGKSVPDLQGTLEAALGAQADARFDAAKWLLVPIADVHATLRFAVTK